MAEILAGRFDELVAACRTGNASVVTQMRELVTWAERYPALVQNLGSTWFTRAEDEIRRCGIPNWYGVAGAGQTDAFATGYYGAVEVTWILDQIDASGFKASYRPDVTNSFVIPPGECEVYTVDSAVPNLEMSYLVVDFGVTPHFYRGAVLIDVSFTITDPCDRESPAFSMKPAPFPIMIPLDGWSLTNAAGDEIDGSYQDADTQYQSRWNFTAVEGD